MGFGTLQEAASPKMWNAGFRKGRLLPGPSAIEALARQLETVGDNSLNSIVPPGNQEEALRQWQHYLKTRDTSQFTKRARRCLCSVPTVARDPRFLTLLEQSGSAPTVSMIAALLGAYHALWDSRGENAVFERRLTHWVHNYQGSYRPLRELTTIINEVVGPQAAPLAARSAFHKQSSACHLLEERGLATNTPYASAIAGGILNACVRQLESTGNLNHARYICEQLIPADRGLIRDGAFFNTVKRLVTLSANTTDFALRDVVKNFVLLDPKLGDPRRYPNRWDTLRLSKEAKIVAGWLSEEDLKFFFDLIMERQEDRHHRRNFWLRYVHRVGNSSVAIGQEDRDRLRSQLSDLKKRGRTYANLNTWDVSAFIMDFGKVIVVEFSRTGNACFFYKVDPDHKKIINLQAREFSLFNLKIPNRASERVIHDRNGNWMDKVQQHLASIYQIRE
jgi:hypothetical protein